MNQEELFASAMAAASLELEMNIIKRDAAQMGPVLNMILRGRLNTVEACSLAIDKLAMCRNAIIAEGPEGTYDLYLRMLEKHGISPS